MTDETPSDAAKDDEKVDDDDEVVSALSTAALEQKLQTLRDQSNRHSQLLTQKLATSQSGQNLLHIGSSLSSLPPDLHSLLTHLHPVLSAAETTEKQFLGNLQKLVAVANEIRLEQRRVEHASECADLYEDLCVAEQHVNLRKRNILEVEAGVEKDMQGEFEE
jgi:conserved oligomeric Golgi complex subunit 2